MHLGNTIYSGTLGASSISLADKMVEVEQEAAPGFRPSQNWLVCPASFLKAVISPGQGRLGAKREADQVAAPHCQALAQSGHQTLSSSSKPDDAQKD